jgi:tungstate transport system substrate-binding protein
MRLLECSVLHTSETPNWRSETTILKRLLTLVSIASLAVAPLRAETIVLASTTAVLDSGLLGAILPSFTGKTGIQVKVLAQGSGQALDSAAQGLADIVLVNSPEAEAAFVAAGHGLPPREIAWNDFMLVGPKSDTAKIANTRNALSALKAIAAKGSTFITRGDRSGTEAAEKALWKAAEIDPNGRAWYVNINGGMEAALRAAVERHAIVLTDHGTWISLANKGDLIELVHGDRAFISRYDVIELNPATHPQAKLEAAHLLAEWLASTDGQNAIAQLSVEGEQLFHPDADHPYPRN